ncbi:hypothetical protein [Nannocystis radixulma]|uniref:Uncharacterized protein n=1 Tax=Nannocystis radixulma TaxID=2995305 RepID=A0ABT5BMV9_9BACT|nr:hypothetical protein [Nannocystis radixulma]MDC0675512.1 hypothetical protein [Nannocystis radixulma]
MRGGWYFLLVMVSCGPGIPSTSTDTDASGGTVTDASAATTASGTSSDAGTTTAEPTTTDATTTSTGVEPATTSTTGDGTTLESTTTTSSTDTTGGALPSCCMVPPVANAEVSGETPLGAIALTWAWFAVHGGECGGSEVLVYEDPSQIDSQFGPQLQIWPADSKPGKQPAVFYVIDAQGMVADVEGEVEIVAIDEAQRPSWCMPGDPVVETDARAELSFTIVADGWDVAGTVDAVYCPQLNQICP